MNQLQTHVDWCKDILQRKKSVDILQAHALIGQCRGVLNEEKKNIYKPSHVRYEINKELVEDVRSAVSSMGQVVVSNTDPSQSLAGGTGLKVGEVGREANITLTTKDFDGNQYYDENDRIGVTVKTPSSKGLTYMIEPDKNGEYIVSYTPDCFGKHEVLITVNDELLNGSPWSVYVTHRQYKYSFSIGSHAREQGQFFRPISIAIDDKSGNVAVADENRVQIYSLEGTYLRDVGKNRLSSPTSVAFTKASELIVVSSNTIFFFDQSYRFVKTITNTHLNAPRPLTVAVDGRMVVCDWGDRTVKVLSSDGSQLLLTIRESTNALPRHAISHQKMIFVSCYLAGVVKVFNEKDGVFLYSIGISNLSSPVGLEVDRFDNLVVCDRDKARLQIFTLDGKFLNTVEGRHNGLSEPYSIAVSSASQLFVTDYSKHCVHVFQ